MHKRGINIDSPALIFSFIIIAQLMSYVISQGRSSGHRSRTTRIA